jgi:hypothetical protein
MRIFARSISVYKSNKLPDASLVGSKIFSTSGRGPSIKNRDSGEEKPCIGAEATSRSKIRREARRRAEGNAGLADTEPKKLNSEGLKSGE